jgi:hypothetical protein
MTATDGDELDELASLGELLGFIDKRDGRQKLKALLDARVEDGTRRESMQLAACELKAAGKHQVAELVKAAALRCPSMTDLRFCHYMNPPYTDNPQANASNIASWTRGEQRRAERERRKCRALLSRKGIDVARKRAQPPRNRPSLPSIR